MYLCVYVCMYGCMDVCIYMYVCMYVCMCNELELSFFLLPFVSVLLIPLRVSR